MLINKKKNIILILSSLVAFMFLAESVAAATQVVEDPCGTTAIYNRPVPNAEFKIGDSVNFAGKMRVTGCGNGLFFNRVTFYIAEDKDIPVTTTTLDSAKFPLNYGNCFGASSSAYGDCSGIERGPQVQIIDLSKGHKIRKLGTIYLSDALEKTSGAHWVEFNKDFTIPADLGFGGDVRFYVEYSGAHWDAHWHWLIAYQKGRIIPFPRAVIECDNSRCGAGSSCLPTARAYEPIAKPFLCFYVLKNRSSVFNLKESNWYVKLSGLPDSAYKKAISCGSLCDYVLQKDMTAGKTYTIKLEVKDKYEQSANTTVNVYVAHEIQASFQCAIFSGSENLVWRDCEELSGAIAKGGKICLKDTSRPSEGAVINSWKWTVNSKIVGDTSEICFNSENANWIKLTALDSANRSDYSEILLNARPIPKWEEVAP